MENPTIDVRWVSHGDEERFQLGALATAFEREPGIRIERVSDQGDVRSKDGNVIALVIAIVGAAPSAWQAFVATLEWWSSRGPKYSVKLEIPDGHIEISNLGRDEAVALFERYAKQQPMRIKLAKE